MPPQPSDNVESDPAASKSVNLDLQNLITEGKEAKIDFEQLINGNDHLVC